MMQPLYATLWHVCSENYKTIQVGRGLRRSIAQLSAQISSLYCIQATLLKVLSHLGDL